MALASYSKYIKLRTQKVTNSMSGAFIFAYNEYIDSVNRKCTIKGRVCVRAYITGRDYKSTSSVGSSYNMGAYYNSTTELNLNGSGSTKSNTNYNSKLKNSNNVNNVGVNVSNLGLTGGWSTSNGLTGFWGGFFALTDEFSWTLNYGNDTTRDFTMSGTQKANFSGNWSVLNNMSLSGTIRLPYLENGSKVQRKVGSGSWDKDTYVYKKVGDGAWEKAFLWEKDGSSEWYKINL